MLAAEDDDINVSFNITDTLPATATTILIMLTTFLLYHNDIVISIRWFHFKINSNERLVNMLFWFDRERAILFRNRPFSLWGHLLRLPESLSLLFSHIVN